MRIAVISDTHGLLPALGEWPEVDLFIHAGDAGPSPNFDESDRALQREWCPSFLRWLDAIPATSKVFVPGNHDLFMQQSDEIEWPSSVVVLTHAGINDLRLFGSAWTYWDRSIFQPPWAFGADEDVLKERFRQIPDTAEILVCHSGARGVLDNGPGREVGSTSLRHQVEALPNLKLFLHGHAHESVTAGLEVGNTLWVNAAERLILLDWSGTPTTSDMRTLWQASQAGDVECS